MGTTPGSGLKIMLDNIIYRTINDKKIICTEQIYNNIEYGCDLSISYKNYNNLEEYINDAKNGFGYEWRNPNFNERMWRIENEK